METNKDGATILDELLNVHPIMITKKGDHYTIMRLDSKSGVEFVSNGQTLLGALKIAHYVLIEGGK